MAKSLSRRDVMRLGALGVAGGVGAAALAACGEGEVEVRTVEVEKIVTVTEIKEVEVEKVVEKEVVREVPVERVVTQEVEKIVEKVVEVPQETQVAGVFEIGPVKAVRFGNYRDLTPYNPQYGGKITHAAPGAINNLDPLHFPDAWSLMGGGQPLFDALIAHGPGGQLAPWLATDWSVSDDLLTYTFQLRNDVQFHDGTPFNAEAAKFNFELWMDPDMNPGWNANIGNQLASVSAPGDFTLEMTLNEVNVFFLDLLAGGSAVFASPKAVAEYGEDLTRNPVSTGPYKFKEWKENISLTMVRNDDYNWGPPWALNQGPAFADEWTSFELTDVSAKVAAYEAEELSWMHHYSLTELQPFFGSPAHQVFIGLGPGQPWYLQTNTINFPTDDLAVRKALIHATDRGTVTRSVTLGFGAPGGQPAHAPVPSATTRTWMATTTSTSRRPTRSWTRPATRAGMAASDTTPVVNSWKSHSPTRRIRSRSRTSSTSRTRSASRWPHPTWSGAPAVRAIPAEDAHPQVAGRRGA